MEYYQTMAEINHMGEHQSHHLHSHTEHQFHPMKDSGRRLENHPF